MFKRTKDSKYAHVPESQNEPLDSEEQDKIIAELREQAIQQANFAKSAVFYVCLAISIGFAIMSVVTMISPWQISHQSVFKDMLMIEVFEIYYALSSINAAVLAFAVKDPNISRSDWRILSIIFLSLGMLIFWSYLFYFLGVTNPILMWLPLQGVAMALLAYYIRSDSQSMITDVSGLENVKYEFKKI